MFFALVLSEQIVGLISMYVLEKCVMSTDLPVHRAYLETCRTGVCISVV